MAKKQQILVECLGIFIGKNDHTQNTKISNQTYLQASKEAGKVMKTKEKHSVYL